MAIYYPDTYFLRLATKPDGKDYAILSTWDGTPIDFPHFASFGNSSFFFQILGNPFAFRDVAPMTWGKSGLDLQPPGNHHDIMEGGSILVLNVVTAQSPPGTPPTYHFNLRFTPDVELLSHDGLRPLDPTIVENPPING